MSKAKQPTIDIDALREEIRAEIKEQIEELILADESLDYTVKSQKINELLLVVEEINKHSLAEDKERLFNQMNEKIYLVNLLKNY